MATTILTKRSNTASAVPLAADLTNSSSGSELAVNTADKRLFTKDSGGTVVELGINPSSLTLSGGTANGVLYLNGSKVATSGSALTFDGTALGVAGTANNVISVTSTATTTALKLDNTHANGWGSNLAIFTGGTAAGYFGTIGSLLGSTAQDLAVYATSGNGVRFYTNGNNERMRLDSSGNLGIGTSSPSRKLDVQVSSDGIAASFGKSSGTMQPRLVVKASESASTVTIGTDYAGSTSPSIVFETAVTERMRLDSSGNLGLGVTPSAWYSTFKAYQFGGYGSSLFGRSENNTAGIASNGYVDSAGNWKYINSNYASYYQQLNSQHQWYIAASGTAGNAITFTQALTLDASGNLLLGSTSQINGERLSVVAGASNGVYFKNTSSANYTQLVWNSATSGDNSFIAFGTEGTYTGRGSITYNRAGGLVAYNVTSDYRAKDIIGPVVNSGTLIDSVPVYMGKMKGATQERPMFIAHETPSYAHTGVKDAVDEHGNPVYQQMDASALIPVMWAEIQSLRKRLADAGIA